ncbi:MAG TPA: uroporphyrinogen decarboxylase family protein [Anaerolineaceae bacterium]
MTILRLRNHIPISGPARREPVDGSETALRVSLGFEPAWYHHRCGVDFSERWHTDPFYRHDTLVSMKAELHRAFPMVTYWDPARQEDTWTLSGCYGAYVIPQVFGCRLQYAPDRWPIIVERPNRSLEEWAALKVDEVLEHPFVTELLGQMETIATAAGMIHGYLTWHSTINNAFNLRGQALFTDMVDQPELTHRFLALVCEVMIRLAQRVQARQRESGFPINQCDISNCVMNMISPRAYRNFIFPYDLRTAESFERFGVHTCNWDVSPYLNELVKLPKVGYLDMGIMSDMRRAREMFPEARRAVMYSPVRLNDASLDEIRADMRKIYADLAPCDVVMADIQAQTPDERVRDLLAICKEIEAGG